MTGKLGELPKLVDLTVKSFKLDPGNTGLLIVDMDNYTCHPEGFLARLGVDVSELRKPIPNIRRLRNFFRKNKLKVIYTTGSTGEGLDAKAIRKADQQTLEALEKLNLKSFPRIREGFEKGHFGLKGKNGFRIVDELTPREGEIVIGKSTSGAFSSSDIDEVLKREGIKTLIITGVATNVCVGVTAMDAVDRGYNCILVSDATSTFYEKWQEAALETFDFRFGKVMTTDEVIHELKRVLCPSHPDLDNILVT